MNAGMLAPAGTIGWRRDAAVAATWGALAGVSTVAVLPYLFQLDPSLAQRIPLPLPLFALLQGVQGFLLLGLLSFLGRVRYS